jgi:cellulose synthase/poly-beta-1,6-N-acetylglucosamine synthase-like glycosyltransferase
VDSDSFPAKNSLQKTIGYFDDASVGVVTLPILVRNKSKFLSRMQQIEYAVIALTRKLLEPLDAIYVTPGPFALYRRSALEKTKGFNKNNLTEDIEMTWQLAGLNFKRMMNLNSVVTTIAPKSWRVWWKQRNRWALGGLQTFWQYRNKIFRENILGYFIIPFFGLGFLLGILGIIIASYMFYKRFIESWLIMHFSLASETAVLNSSLLNFSPSVLNYFGIALFIMMFLFTVLVLSVIDAELFKGKRILDLLLFLTIYVLLSPVVLATAIFKLLKGDMRW